MLFTVFTPTYNRSSLLPRLFESLQKQTMRNFEWLIVDDGSTDDTPDVVGEFIKKASFPVRFIQQKNQGKHIAINTALQAVRSEWLLTIDSDDFLAPNCLEICAELAAETRSENFGGFTFIHAPEEFQTKHAKTNSKKWTEYNSYCWDFAGEMVYIFKTAVAKKFPFPVIKEEKFCQESVQIIPVVKNCDILFTEYILAFGEYLEDGLSQNLYQRLLQNPKYAMLSLKTKLQVAKSNEERLQLAKNYWDIALKTGQPKLKAFARFPFYLNLITFINLLLRKFKN